jgi:hypothetical protein
LDLLISTNNTCLEHHVTPNSYTRKIREWCELCSGVSYFKQVVSRPFSGRFYISDIIIRNTIEKEKNCKSCGKLIFQHHSYKYKFNNNICSCYQTSFGWSESTLTKKPIPILHLPWWDAFGTCVACNLRLESISDCQKWCSNCIIVYTGCRYCLTTNIIFGITNQSQCKKCKRLTFIDIDVKSIESENRDSDVNEFLHTIITGLNTQIASYKNKLDENSDLLGVYNFIKKNKKKYDLIKWIPYSQITNLKKIAEGGFGIVYKAEYDCETVAIKKFLNSQNISKYFLNKVTIFTVTLYFINEYEINYYIYLVKITMSLWWSRLYY